MSDPVSRFTVPVSPSTNNLYVNRRFGQGRARSPAYDMWIVSAGWTVKLQRPVRVPGGTDARMRGARACRQASPARRGCAARRSRPRAVAAA